ncbi:MAG: hypothetical protein ACFE9R_19375 [Candidatus Hermodarchaeota archaeon]
MDNSLTNILEIYRLVSQKLYKIDDAFREIGMKNNIEISALRQTCTKKLNISTEVFENFLQSSNRFNFKNFLTRRFPRHITEIIRFFNALENADDIPVLDLRKVFKTSAFAKSASLGRDVMMNELENSFQDWIARNDVPQDVKDELKGWIKKIDGCTK